MGSQRQRRKATSRVAALRQARAPRHSARGRYRGSTRSIAEPAQTGGLANPSRGKARQPDAASALRASSGSTGKHSRSREPAAEPGVGTRRTDSHTTGSGEQFERACGSAPAAIRRRDPPALPEGQLASATGSGGIELGRAAREGLSRETARAARQPRGLECDPTGSGRTVAEASNRASTSQRARQASGVFAADRGSEGRREAPSMPESTSLESVRTERNVQDGGYEHRATTNSAELLDGVARHSGRLLARGDSPDLGGSPAVRLRRPTLEMSGHDLRSLGGAEDLHSADEGPNSSPPRRGDCCGSVTSTFVSYSQSRKRNAAKRSGGRVGGWSHSAC